MNNREGDDYSQETFPIRSQMGAHPRAVGSPLPRGATRRPVHSANEGERQLTPPPPPGRALNPPPASAETDSPSNNLQRAVNALRGALPFVQRILPLLDGNFASAVANMLAPHPQKGAPAPSVNLAPLEDNVAELRVQHRELHDQIVEQNSSLKRVEDQLEAVREATDRNTLEQQELMEDLKSMGNKMNMVALAAFALLAVSVLLNLILYLHIQRVLP